jgi:hypothetical protein
MQGRALRPPALGITIPISIAISVSGYPYRSPPEKVNCAFQKSSAREVVAGILPLPFGLRFATRSSSILLPECPGVQGGFRGFDFSTKDRKETQKKKQLTTILEPWMVEVRE